MCLIRVSFYILGTLIPSIEGSKRHDGEKSIKYRSSLRGGRKRGPKQRSVTSGDETRRLKRCYGNRGRGPLG